MTQPVAGAATTWDDLSDPAQSRLERGRPTLFDVLFFLLLSVGAGVALTLYSQAMDSYEKVILVLTVPFLTWLGWLWRPLRTLMIVIALSAGLALWLYQGDIARADQAFLLKYLLSSQSAILWMCALFVVATV